jgi:hypothetical protein
LIILPVLIDIFSQRKAVDEVEESRLRPAE